MKIAPPSRENTPGIRYLPMLGVSFFLLVFLSLLYPLAAFPTTGMWIVGCMAVAMGSLSLLRHQLGLFSRREMVALGFVILWMGWILFQAYRSPYAPTGWRDAAIWMMLPLGFVPGWFFTQLFRPTEEHSLQNAPMVAVGTLIALLAISGLYQVYGTAAFPGSFAHREASLLANSQFFHPDQLAGLLHLVREGRASGWVGASNIYAGFLVLLIPLGMALLLGCAGTSAKWRVLGALWVVLAFWGILLSGSRGGAAAALLAFFLSLTLLVRLRTKPSATAASVVGAALLCIPQLLSAQSLFQRGLSISTLKQRFYYWEAAWGMFLDSPVWGKGLGAFEVLYPVYRVVGSQETRHAHSWLFDLLPEQGLLGVILFLALPLLVIFPHTSGWESKTVHPFRVPVLIAITCGFFHGLLEYTFAYAEFLLIWSLLLGFAFGLGLKDVAPSSKSPSLSRFAPALLVIQILVLLPIFWRGVFVPGRVEQLVTESEFVLEEGAPGIAFGLLTQALEWEDSNADLWLNRSRLAGVLGENPETDLEQARLRNPHSARILELQALQAAATGNMSLAVEKAFQAHQLHPLDVGHRLTCVELLLQAEPDSPERREQISQLLNGIEDLHKSSTSEFKRLESLPPLDLSLPGNT